LFPDTSSYNHTVTANGNAQVDTAIKPSGASGSLLVDGTGDYLSIPDDTSFDLGTGDFTIILDFYENTKAGSYPNLIAPSNGWNDGFFAIRYNNNGHANKVGVFWNPEGDPFMMSTNTFATQTWHNVRLVRSGTAFTLYINDTSEDTAISTASVVLTDGASLWIGAGGASDYFDGNIANVKIYKDLAITP